MKPLDEEGARAKLSFYGRLICEKAQSSPIDELKSLIRRIVSYEKKLARAIARRGHHKAANSRSGGVNFDPDNE